MPETAAERLVPPPSQGRIFSSRRLVRFGDLHRSGRVRLDALGAYFQDIASEDAVDAGLGREMVWVVRRSVFEVRVAARFLEELVLTTWCSGLGSCWGERRLSIRGDRGASIEAGMLWVSLDQQSGRPRHLTPEQLRCFGTAAAGRQVSGRLQHDPPPDDPSLIRRSWPLRATDFDPLGHVNNAAAWAMAEEIIDDLDRHVPFRAEMEYRQPVERGAEVELVTRTQPGSEGVDAGQPRVDGDPGRAGVAGSRSLWVLGRSAGRDPAAPPELFTTARVVALVS